MVTKTAISASCMWTHSPFRETENAQTQGASAGNRRKHTGVISCNIETIYGVARVQASMRHIGGAVKGGRVVADWPGLAPSSLYQARDLRPTDEVVVFVWVRPGIDTPIYVDDFAIENLD